MSNDGRSADSRPIFEELGPVDSPSSPRESQERITSHEIRMSRGVYEELERRTRAIQRAEEFAVLLVGNGNTAQHVVSIGIGGTGAAVNVENIAQILAQLQPYINKGMHVLAAYHNHPHRCYSRVCKWATAIIWTMS